MESFAPGALLFQASLTATPTTALVAAVPTEITKIIVCNASGHSGTTSDFSIFHDENGDGFSATTALYFHVELAKQQTVVLDINTTGNGIQIGTGGKLGVAGGTAHPITISVYGVTRVGR